MVKIFFENTFSDDDEKKFLDEYIGSGLFQIRTLYFLGFVLYGVFSILDIWLLPESKKMAWIIRFGMVMPMFLLAFYLTFTSAYKKFHEVIATIIFFCAGMGIVLMMAFSKLSEPGYTHYYTGLILVLMAIYSGTRIRLKISLLNGVGINLAYPTAAILIQNIQGTNVIGWVIIINNLFFLTGAHILGLFAGYYLEFAFRANFKARQRLQQEHDRAESLLQAILPDSIAKRLKSGETTIADEYDNISILFADIVGFTKLSHSIAPLPLVKILNKLFSEFDDVAARYGIEKIKTIGDNYMIAAGIPVSRANHADLLADFAIDIRNKSKLMRLKSGEFIQIRIGIHSGKAAGGVIGKNKFIFDVWGDAVNIASRMESSGVPGEIQISEATYYLLKDRYTCEERGEIDIKGKGNMKVFILKNKLGSNSDFLSAAV